jgi:hypothetical protein
VNSSVCGLISSRTSSLYRTCPPFTRSSSTPREVQPKEFARPPSVPVGVSLLSVSRKVAVPL